MTRHRFTDKQLLVLVRWMEKSENYDKLYVHGKDNRGLTTDATFGEPTEYFKRKLMADQTLRSGMDLETLTIAHVKKRWEGLQNKYGKGKGRATGDGHHKIPKNPEAAKLQKKLQDKMVALTQKNTRYNPPITRNLGLPASNATCPPPPPPPLPPHLEEDAIEEASEDNDDDSSAETSASESTESSATERSEIVGEDWPHSEEEDDDLDAPGTSATHKNKNNKRVRQVSPGEGPSDGVRTIRTRTFRPLTPSVSAISGRSINMKSASIGTSAKDDIARYLEEKEATEARRREHLERSEKRVNEQMDLQRQLIALQTENVRLSNRKLQLDESLTKALTSIAASFLESQKSKSQ
ncbi:hypothetical protein BGX21_005893 [Mortierella sp. AD011]|nr:hypothetical protein BGX21_005893 [Mortierella sp. AD011]